MAKTREEIEARKTAKRTGETLFKNHCKDIIAKMEEAVKADTKDGEIYYSEFTQCTDAYNVGKFTKNHGDGVDNGDHDIYVWFTYKSNDEQDVHIEDFDPKKIDEYDIHIQVEMRGNSEVNGFDNIEDALSFYEENKYAPEESQVIEVDYVSTWEEGTIETKAKLDLRTGEVTDIESSDEGQHYENLISEKIRYRDRDYFIENDERMLDYSIDKDDLKVAREASKYKSRKIKHLGEYRYGAIEEIAEDNYLYVADNGTDSSGEALVFLREGDETYGEIVATFFVSGATGKESVSRCVSVDAKYSESGKYES